MAGKRKILTLCLAVRDGEILLGVKKRGFGMGRWDGFGGKVEPGETIEEAAKREMFEECGVGIEKMEQVGTNEFEFSKNRGEILEVHVFRVDAFDGDPEKTEEMHPRWFRFDEIPYKEMRPDNEHWLPLFLDGKKFCTRFLFGDGDAVLEKKTEEM